MPLMSYVVNSVFLGTTARACPVCRGEEVARQGTDQRRRPNLHEFCGKVLVHVSTYALPEDSGNNVTRQWMSTPLKGGIKNASINQPLGEAGF